MGRNTTILERRFVPKDTIILNEGDEGYSAYLIQSGAVVVFTKNDDREIELARLEIGQIFGEMALVFDERRTASVRTVEDCNLIVITRDSFRQKLERSDPTIRAIVTMLMQRIVSANNAMINRKETLQDLIDTSQIIYDNVVLSLPPNQKRSFENAVLPKLTEFMETIRAFQEKFSEEI